MTSKTIIQEAREELLNGINKYLRALSSAIREAVSFEDLKEIRAQYFGTAENFPLDEKLRAAVLDDLISAMAEQAKTFAEQHETFMLSCMYEDYLEAFGQKTDQPELMVLKMRKSAITFDERLMVYRASCGHFKDLQYLIESIKTFDQSLKAFEAGAKEEVLEVMLALAKDLSSANTVVALAEEMGNTDLTRRANKNLDKVLATS